MKHILTLISVLLIWHSSAAQKRKLEFFADEAGTQPITTLKSGQTTFYAVAPMNKKDFKAPFGKLFMYGKYNFIQSRAQVEGLKSGVSTKEETIYDNIEEIGKTYEEIANNEGKLTVRIKLDEYVNFEKSMTDVVEYGNKVYPLTVRLGESNEPLGTGVLQWDLSDGGKAYSAAMLAGRSDYTFEFGDAIDDPDFKKEVKTNIEQRYKVRLYQMAHGERVPYERDYKFYRRNSIAVTLKDLEDENCYTANISAFEDGTGPSGPPYRYDNDGRINYGDQIPCDRVDK